MQQLGQPPPSARRADIDSLRVLALVLLIAYHLLLVYSGRDFWRVTSGYSGYWADYIITLLRPWRILLVFLIGGVAARFMLDRLDCRALMFDRISKLGMAFVFAVIVIVPVQRYVRLDALGLDHGQSYLGYFLHDAWRVERLFGAPLPEFSHAWFLTYLLGYSLLVALAWRYARGGMQGAIAWVARAPAAAIVLATMAWFAVLTAFLDPVMRPTNMLVDDVSGHLRYAPVFLLGVFIGKNDAFWAKLDAAKWGVWSAAALLAPLNVVLLWLVLHDRVDSPVVWQLVCGGYGGAMVFGVAAFGHWALNRPSQLLSFASDAILPVYLMHQSFLVVFGDAIVGRHWPVLVEGATLFAAALLAPLAIYCLFVRHIGVMRVLFGLRPRLRQPAPHTAHLAALAAQAR